jgi:hypothetical protein
MPPELPKKLPPRQDVDHHIKLELGAKPPTMAPYCMTPPKLTELNLATSKEPVVVLPDCKRPFKVHKKQHTKTYVKGDLVMVKLLPNKLKSPRNVHKGLVRRYEGPFPVIKHVGKVAYQVQLSSKRKIHNVFHVSLLKPFHGNDKDPGRSKSTHAPTAKVTKFDKEVESILADRVTRRRGVPNYTEYLVKWKDLPDEEVSWEQEDLLWQFADFIHRYKDESATRTSRKQVGEGVTG